MPFDIETLLPLAESVKPRTPTELREWVLVKCDAFAQIPELRAPVLRHEGIFKWFHEEIYPLSIFAVRRYGDRDDILCVPKRDQAHDIDAEIREPARTINVEITGAREPGEHLRMEYLIEHRRVSLTGAVWVTGTKKTGRQIGNELEYVDHEKTRASHLNWIKTAAEGKAGKGRYGKSYELLISVDDWWFDVGDEADVTNFIEREVLGLPLNFDAVHVVGLTGRLFLSFSLPR